MASILGGNKGPLGSPAKLSHGIRPTTDLSKRGAVLTREPGQGSKLPAAAWSNTWPAPGATLDLDFANDRGFVRGVGQGSSMQAVTFTRASAGQYIDKTGTLQSNSNNVPRFDWASTAQAANKNLLSYTEQFDNTVWQKQASTVSANSTTAPDGSTTADTFIENTANTFHYVSAVITTISNTTYTVSIYCKAAGRTRLRLGFYDNALANGVYTNADFTAGTTSTATAEGTAVAGTAAIQSLTDSWYRISVSGSIATTSTRIFINLLNNSGQSSYTGDGTSGVYLWGAQTELGSSATTYQAIAQPTTNTPLAANPTCNGLLIEESRANRLLWCRDASNAAWTKTNVAAAKDQTGIDGVASSASSLTASAGNGTCIQTITLASGSRTCSVYLKRITGTGNVQVTLDGSTYSTVDLSSTEWRRIVLSGTVTNPTVGIRLATNGDAVAMDYGQIEDGAFATSPILTTTASVTRSADVATMPISYTWYNQGSQTIFSTIKFTNYVSGSGFSGGIVGFGASFPRIYLSRAASTGRPYQSQLYDGTRNFVVSTLTSSDSANGVNHNIAISYDNANLQLSADGVSGSVFVGNYVGLPAIGTNMQIGNRPDTTSLLNGWISRLVIYPKRINENSLNNLTGITI